MKTNKTFRDRVTIGCAIYLFCTTGFLTINMAGYSLFPETYGTDVSLVSTALSTQLMPQCTLEWLVLIYQ